MGRKSKYSAEFRADAVRLSREPGHSSETVAADLGLTGITIRRWRHEFEATADPELRQARAEHAELVGLRRRIRVLEEEREILAKAAAFLGREMEPGRAARTPSSTERRPTTTSSRCAGSSASPRAASVPGKPGGTNRRAG
jgi:transposase